MRNCAPALPKSSSSRIANAMTIHALARGRSRSSGLTGRCRSCRLQGGDASVCIHVGEVVQLEVVRLELYVHLPLKLGRKVVRGLLVRGVDLYVGIGHVEAAAR